MSIVETTAPEGTSTRTRVSSALPLLGICLGLIMNAVWVAFLGYCILKLI